MDINIEVLNHINNNAKGYKQSFITLTANYLGIFEVLSKKKYSAEKLAEIMKFDLRAITILLDALVSIGFLKKTGNSYYLIKKFTPFLTQKGKYYIGDSLKHDFNLLHTWIKLPEVIKTGKPARKNKRDKSEQENFILAMANSSLLNVNSFYDSIDLSDCRKFLDVGGGPGIYSLYAVKRNKDLISYNFDLPETIKIAKKYLSKYNEKNRIKLITGDYFKEDFGINYDLILLSNIIHSLGKKDILSLFKKSYIALNNNGRLIVKDFYIKSNRIEPQRVALFAVNMLVNTTEGNTYTVKETIELLKEAGFKKSKYNFINKEIEFIEAFK